MRAPIFSLCEPFNSLKGFSVGLKCRSDDQNGHSVNDDLNEPSVDLKISSVQTCNTVAAEGIFE